MSMYLITRTDSKDLQTQPSYEKVVGYKTSHADASSYLHDMSKEKKHVGWGQLMYPQYQMLEVQEIVSENPLVMSETNKILAKLVDQFGKGVYSILCYDLHDHIRSTPVAVIEHEDGTPTTIYYDKEKGEWM